MSRLERLPELYRAEKQRLLRHLVRLLSVICAAGILLVCENGAVVSDNSFPSVEKSWPQMWQLAQLKTTEPTTAKPEEGTIEGKPTEANPGPVLPPSLSAAAPVSDAETAAPVSVIEAAQIVDKAEPRTKTPQGSSKTGDEMPTLVIDQVISGRPRQPTVFHLSVNADGVLPDHSLVAIHGLPKGTVLSAGRSDGMNGWLLAPYDLLGSGLSITPSANSNGSSDVVVLLLTPEGRVAREVHTKLVVSGGVTVSDNSEPPSPVASTPEEIQVLLSHGRELERVGYLAGARLFFQRAAEAGSAEGARALGETYDPVEFQKLGVHGLAPDPALARMWYDRAQALEEKHLAK